MTWIQRRDGAPTRPVGWAMLDQAVVSGSNFLTIVLVARLLGVAGLGRYSLAWMVVLFAGSLQGALVASPMMSLGPRRVGAAADAWFGSMWRVQLRFAGGAALVSLVASLALGVVWEGARLGELAVPLAIAVLTYQLQDFVRRYHFARLVPHGAFVNDLASAVLLCGPLLAASTLDGGPARSAGGVLWISALAPILPTAWSTRRIRRLPTSAEARRAIADERRSYGRWQLGSALLYWGSANAMVLMSGALLGTAAVGALTALRRIINVANVLLQSIENVVPTQCTIRLERGVPELTRYLWRAGAACVAVTVVFAIAIMATPATWLQLLVGAQYVQFAQELRLFAPYSVLLAIGLVRPAGLRALDSTRYMFRVSLVVAFASLVSSGLLVSVWGLTGAILGMEAAQALIVVLYAVGLRRALRRRRAIERPPVDHPASTGAVVAVGAR